MTSENDVKLVSSHFEPLATVLREKRMCFRLKILNKQLNHKISTFDLKKLIFIQYCWYQIFKEIYNFENNKNVIAYTLEFHYKRLLNTQIAK